jgi:hypothetical protein
VVVGFKVKAMNKNVSFELNYESYDASYMDELEEAIERDEECVSEAKSRVDSKWEFVRDKDISNLLSVNYVDDYLLKIAKKEVEQVHTNLKEQYDKFRNKHNIPQSRKLLKNITAGDMVNMWIPKTFLALLSDAVSSGISTPVNYTDIINFIQVELLLSIYGCSPGAFFDSENELIYMSSRSPISQIKYNAILHQLGKRDNKLSGTDQWQSPFSNDGKVNSAMSVLRGRCVELGYVEGTTIISLDDDQLRLRSHKVDDHGFTRTRNPKKGFGPTQHGAVSTTTSLFIGGHIPVRGESTNDSVEMLFLSLSKANLSNQISLEKSLVALDRGYQGTKLNTFISACNGHVVGTHKQTAGFPFTYDQKGSDSCQRIETEGPMSTYWAKGRDKVGLKDDNRDSHYYERYGLAYKSGLGKVALLSTSFQPLGPGNWSYITVDGRSLQQIKEQDIILPDSLDDFAEFESNITQLTREQRCHDWFISRLFRLTGSVISGVLQSIAGNARNTQFLTIDASIIQLLDWLKIDYTYSPISSQSPIVPETSTDPKDYRKYNLEELRKQCRVLGIALHERHKKANMIDLLVKHNIVLQNRSTESSLWQHILLSESQESTRTANIVTEEFSVEKALMNAWFMRPFKNTATKMGSANEVNVLQHFSSFVEEHTSLLIEHGPIIVSSVKEYGLLAHHRCSHAAFSPDGIAIIRKSGLDTPHYAGIEIKTKVSKGTITAEIQLQEKFGHFAIVNVFQDPGLFSQLVPSVEYRGQVLHLMACGSLNHAFLIFASLTKIIRVIYVLADSSNLSLYILAMDQIRMKYFDWVDKDDEIPARFLTDDCLKFCKDEVTVRCNLQLWKELNRLRNELGMPLPPAKRILPTLVAFWNRVKGGIDVYSRFLKNLKPSHNQLTVDSAIWIRMIMTFIYNAYQSMIIVKIYPELKAGKITTYKDYQRRRMIAAGAFSKFCADVYATLADSFDVDQFRFSLPASKQQDNEIPSITGYKLRNRFMEDETLRKRRLDRSLPHLQGHRNDSKRLPCVLCCKQKEHRNGYDQSVYLQNIATHQRMGFKTSLRCSICNVTLCKVLRWGQEPNQKSCFEIWHTSTELPDAC